MNNLQYNILLKLHNKAHGKRMLSKEYLEELNNDLVKKCKILNCQFALTESDMTAIFETIYDILKVRLLDEEIDKIIKDYIKLLLADAYDGQTVDQSWIIDHLWYLCMGNDKIKDKYKDCVTYIQIKDVL